MSFFTSSSGVAVSFKNPGDTFSGTITGPYTERQETEFGSKELAFWKDGTAKMEALVPMQADHDQLEGPDDDGKRTLYVPKGRLHKAIAKAMQDAGARDLIAGAHLRITFTGYGQGANPSNPPKEYSATFTPPTGAFTAPAPVPAAAHAAAAEPAWVAAGQAASPAPSWANPGTGEVTADVDKIRTLIGMNMPDSVITDATGASPELIAALRAA